MSNGIRDLAALAADDAAVEAAIEQEGGNALRLSLHAYAFHADGDITPADWEEEEANRRALASLAWVLPVCLTLLVIIVLAWRG